MKWNPDLGLRIPPEERYDKEDYDSQDRRQINKTQG
jgi:hypothetical protein